MAPPPIWHGYRYGEHPAQVAELALPSGMPPGRARGVVVMLHGGFWRARYDRSLQHEVAADLTSRGWAVWNVDYRAVPPGPNDGGGWPRTQQDVAAGIDLLATAAAGHGLAELVADGSRVVVAGHSAGGCLALWSAARRRLPAGTPGAAPLVRPRAVIAQAAVCDLVAGARQGLGDGAVVDLMGAPPDGPGSGGPGSGAAAAYALASPSALLPLGVRILLVTGADDTVVPPAQSEDFAAAARAAGDDVRLEIVPGEGHFGHLDPRSRSWHAALSWLS
jgi:acetyl esterase/lipase